SARNGERRMSHYSTFKTKFASREALLKALADVGYAKEIVQVHDQPIHLTGYMGDRREETAEIVIPKRYVRGGANDIGFKLQEDDGCYTAIISEFDSGLGRNDQAWMDKLTQRYAYHASLDALAAQGFELGDCITEPD